MLMCKKDCVYSENGYCLLSAEEHINGISDGCNNYKSRRKNFAKSENKVNSFSNSSDIDKFNGVGNFGTH